MVEDQFHIEMEEISEFSVERSADNSFWEDIAYEEILSQVLKDQPEEKIKRFFGVVRNGGAFKLGDYFYRIKAD
jgi:hypothetical protein